MIFTGQHSDSVYALVPSVHVWAVCSPRTGARWRIPPLNGETPALVLIMGVGDGLLMRELVKHDGIRSIKHVDLDHTLVRLARVHPILTAPGRARQPACRRQVR